TGEYESKGYANKTYVYNGQIGVDDVITVDISELKDLDGNVYTDNKLDWFEVPINWKNKIYAVTGGKSGDDFTYYVSQNMNTQVNASIEENAIILDEDRNSFLINFTVKRTDKNGENEEHPFKNKGHEISYYMDFSEGPMDIWDDLYRGTNSIQDESFNKALYGNGLDIFSYVSGRYQIFHLISQFTGGNAVELNKRYSLDMSGNDLDGWNLVLKSNIKERTEPLGDPEVIKFKTVYENDPTLPVGQEKVKQEGKDGSKQQVQKQYVIYDAQGRAEVLKEIEITTETVDPVDEIILRGTKTEPGQAKTKVSVDPNGGTWADGTTDIKTSIVAVGSDFILPAAPVREGYTFLYWRGSEYQPGDSYTVPAEGHTFTAEWGKKDPSPKPDNNETVAPDNKTHIDRNINDKYARDDYYNEKPSANAAQLANKQVLSKYKGTALPKTGDTLNLPLYVGAFGLVLLSAGALRLRRNN
ncbi:MAG: G5 domain-containing protein, partial [Coriobacteriia bacterium]|nr:G5 domain-containing protein [Coriobacteriia bacterium]